MHASDSVIIMKITFAAILLGFSFTSFPSWGADFATGKSAYYTGDFETAIREWTPLAESGMAEAQYRLGMIYDFGQGVPQDSKTAVKWYTLAAEQGVAGAQYLLALSYENGEGIYQDYKTAVEWYTLAAEQGHAGAQYNLGLMYAKGQGVLQNYIYAHMWWNIVASNSTHGNKDAVKNRDIVAKRMTPSQIEKAQDLARECVAKNFKGC